MYQWILNVPLWNDWSKVTYSQVHGSPVFKNLSFESLNWISVTRSTKFIQFWEGPKCKRPLEHFGLIGKKLHISVSHMFFCLFYYLFLSFIYIRCIYIYTHKYIIVHPSLSAGGLNLLNFQTRGYWQDFIFFQEWRLQF